MEKHVPIVAAKYGISAAPMTPQMFGAAGKEHMEKYGESELDGNKCDLTLILCGLSSGECHTAHGFVVVLLLLSGGDGGGGGGWGGLLQANRFITQTIFPS